MQLNTRSRVIALIALILVLAGAAIFIGWQISVRNQAPTDSAATAWCTAPRPGGQCPVGDPIDGCNVWAWRTNASCGAAGECYQNNNCDAPPPPPGGECSVGFPGGVTGSIQIANCTSNFNMEVYYRDVPSDTTNDACVGTSSNRRDRSVGNGVYSPRNDELGCGKCVQYDIEGRGGVAQFTGNCTETTPPAPADKVCYKCTQSLSDGNTCERFTIPGTQACAANGGSDSATGCAAAATNGQCPVTIVTESCGDALCQTAELCERVTPNGTIFRTCGSATGQAPTGELAPTCTFTGANACKPAVIQDKTCYKCTLSNLNDGNTCEAFVIPSTQTCSTNGGFDTNAACENRLPSAAQCPVIVNDGRLTLLKLGNEVCEAGTNNHLISYTITISNIGTTGINYSSVVDTIQQISTTNITAITGGGVLTANSITWAPGSLAAGQSVNYTYTLKLTQAQGDAVNDMVSNQVVVNYTANGAQQITYTNNQSLTCSQLPKTAIQDDIMWVVAIMLILTGIIVYRQKVAAQFTQPLLIMAGQLFEKVADQSPLNRGKKGRKSFEKKLLEDNAKR